MAGAVTPFTSVESPVTDVTFIAGLSATSFRSIVARSKPSASRGKSESILGRFPG